jgi:hypothetical protein
MDAATEAPAESLETAKEKDEHGLVRASQKLGLDDFVNQLLLSCLIPTCPEQRLPLARVKKLVKADGDVKAVANEAAFLIAKATVSKCSGLVWAD